METQTLMCFGGPLNGELLAVTRPDVIEVPLRPAFAEYHRYERLSDAAVMDTPTIRYLVEKVYLHDEAGHWGPPSFHDESCYVTGSCLVAKGYPKHRITDALNTLVWIIRSAPFIPKSEPPKIASRSGE